MRVLAFFALAATVSSTAMMTGKDGTITKVVKLLQGMMDKSKAEGDAERKIYAKFKCYCDQSEATKNENIKELTDQIEILGSKIAEVQGDTGELSSECADLKAKIADNEAAQQDATTLRGKENKAFTAEEADLTQAIGQMKSAIETLSAVGADQTKSTGADNKQFMAGKSLLSMKAQVQDALSAASALMNADQRKSMTAFVQGPFTGTYTSQSAQVMGIIKSMRDTFKANLADARTTEANALEAYDKFIAIKKAAHTEMSASYKTKQKDLGDNDDELSSQKKQLSEATKEKASDEEFLGKLLPLCSDKAKGYSNRKMLRANEEAAIAEAISILNSDDAFATFGTTDAAKTGATSAFIQLRSVRKHMSSDAHARGLVQKILQQAAKETKSSRLGKVLASLQAENPFTTVLDEIDKMLDLSAEEGKSDKEKLDWCNKERTENDASLTQKKKDILSLDKTIDKLDTTINDEKTGLKKQIEDTETSLVQNTESQTTETKERTEDNLNYQQDVKNLQAASGILTKGLKVLKVYYDDLAKKLANGEALMQEDPDAPEAWKGDGAYAGQSNQGGDVIKMLEFILDETGKEETQAHADEEKAQADYEDSMTKLKSEEAAAEKSLANLQETLAAKEKELLEAGEDLKTTTADKESIESYLGKIKPGCDFMTTNFAQREKNRATETAALKKAIGLIKATPAYKTAVTAATNESYGDCKMCVDDSAHVDCKSCMADVTVPAYCAGHKGTKGC